ncbi:hypothetical protein [Streptomyces sp. NPDC127084]|uniref:hypothetical protein n=1 Tax=Streptomyces sp. NPDC127084 TaxID=3347133 RepID=UPI0036644290
MGRRSVSLGMAAGLLLAGVAAVPAHAAVVNVACTEAALRTAIANSNAGTGDTLILASYCPYVLTDAGGGALPQISQPLIIQGNNATIKRDTAASNFRIFDVGATSLTMDTLTVMNGQGGNGGGVFLNTSGGSLTTTDVNFQGNGGANGGGIFAAAGTSVSLTGGTVSDNRSTGLGGGIAGVSTASLTLDSVTVVRNRSGSFGGGVSLNTSTPAMITSSTISNNTASAGGGGTVYAGSSSLTVTDSTITNNRVTSSTQGGAGIRFAASSTGTGMITGSTVSGNTVTGYTDIVSGNRGGGIHVSGGTLTVDSTTVSGNQLVGAFGQGGGIAADEAVAASALTLQNGTALTANLASGRYSQGGGLYAGNTSDVSVDTSSVDSNKVTGTGSAAAGLYNNGANVTFTGATVNNNTAPSAPAPGGVYTTVPIGAGGTVTGNFPTNCLFSPQPVTGCIG